MSFQASPVHAEKTIPDRIPSLDGCRAISILLVLLSHICETPSLQAFNPYSRMMFHFGPFGVKVFFVISGFLITTLLLNEERKHGRISIKMFYLRRAFRIWPVAYAYLLVVALLAWKHVINVPTHHLVYAGAFLMNHVQETNWFTGHFWSLAIEEQFYLVWPVVFLLTKRRGRVVSCFLVLFLSPFLRTLAYVYEPHVYGAMQLSLLFMGDAIAIGCLLALLSPELENSRLVRRLIHLRWFFAVPALSVAMYATLKVLPTFYFAAGESIALLCIALSVWKFIHVRDTAFRVLNSRPMVTIGVFSYSLYVWQQLFLNPAPGSIFRFLPLDLLLVCVAAAVSYYWIEGPFLRLRPRVSRWFESRQRGVDPRVPAGVVSTRSTT